MWLKNLKIWDGVSDQLSDADAVHIEEGKISAVESSDAAGAESGMDLSGLVAIPGLVDAHVHMCLNPDIKTATAQGEVSRDQLLREMIIRSEQMLRAGITTARDLGGGRWIELELRDLINEGKVLGPRLVCAGQPITSVKGHCHFWGGEAQDVDEALTVIDRQTAHDVDLIKVMATGGTLTPGTTPKDAQFDVEVLTEIVRLANQKDYRVAAHCHGTSGIRNASEAGVTTIEHCSWVGDNGWAKDFDADVVDQIANKGIWVSPTVNVGWQRRIGSDQLEELLKENFAKMRAAGVRLIASTDAGIPNVRHHDLPKALAVFAYFAGFSPVETLRAATSDCADAIGLGDIAGQISVGFDADLVLYEHNPLDELNNLEQPVRVVRQGHFIE